MNIDQFQMIFGFAGMVAILLLVAAIGVKLHREFTKPRGTYGNGLPERRKRKRIELPDPAKLQPNPVAPGETI